MHQSEIFLKRLAGLDTKYLFQTFDGKGKDYQLTRTLYGTFSQHQGSLTALNSQGADIFVTVNKTKGNRRRLEDIEYCRAIWQEDDKNTDKILELQPHITVLTSPGHYHRYWLHTPQDDLDVWGRAQRQMVKQFDSDPGAKDGARVMRLPGFYNNKRGCDAELLSNSPRPIYTWEEITAALGFEEPAIEEPQQPSTLDDYTQQILAGEHLHTPIRAIMLINANKGFDIVYNRLICTALINSCPDQDRKRKALHDLESMLRSTYKKIEDECADDVTDLNPAERSTMVLEWPPGLMGELAKSAFNFAAYPNKTICIVTAMCMVAGIVGRKYNVSNSGLNMYATIMAGTGAGKDTIRKFCSQVFSSKTLFGDNGTSFYGGQNFTGPKSLRDSLMSKPSQLCVMTEAGLLYKSDSGDKDGLTRAILEAYTSSGRNDTMGAELYSDPTTSIAPINAPALSILNEATPVTLQAEYNKRESINTGELPRMWIFNIKGKKPYANLDPFNLDLSPKVADRLTTLMTEAYAVQNAGKPSVTTVPLPPKAREYSDWCVDKENEYASEEPNRAVMYTRAYHKVLKAAALLAVFNGDATISNSQWEWAKHLFEYEMAHISDVIGGNSPHEDGRIEAMGIIYGLLNDQYKHPTQQMPRELKQRGIFRISPFKQIARRRPIIKALATKFGRARSGETVILDYMEDEGYIVKVTKPIPGVSKMTPCYKITPLFKQVIESMT